MAPEILDLIEDSKEDSSYTSAVDLWSLGCLLYYLLTKTTPFSVYELQTYAKGYTEFPHNALVEREVSPSGQSFIKSLLTPSPKDRPTASVNLITDWIVEHENTVLYIPHSMESARTEQESQTYIASEVTFDNPPTLPLEAIPPVEPEMVCNYKSPIW